MGRRLTKADRGIITEAMRLLGSRTSDKKAASSAANGKKGGRPKRTSYTLTKAQTALWESDSEDAAQFRRSARIRARLSGLTEIYSHDGVMLEAVDSGY